MNTLNISSLRKSLSLKQKDFSNSIGIAQSYLSELERGVKPVTEDVYRSIENTYGKESIKRHSSTHCDNIAKVENKIEKRAFIRYWVDVDVTGGGVALFDDTLSDNYEDMLIPEFRDCTDAVNLYGDSMSPRYNAGQIIILKEWTDSFIAYGQVYLVITKSGFRTVKYLRKGAKDNEVLCVSENKNYDPFPVNREDILKLYLVKGTIEKTTL